MQFSLRSYFILRWHVTNTHFLFEMNNSQSRSSFSVQVDLNDISIGCVMSRISDYLQNPISDC